MALQVIDSESGAAPEGEDKPGQYSGRHRGSDRLRQFAQLGMVLGMAAFLLAVGGGVLWWMSRDNGGTEPVDVAAIEGTCALTVDEEGFGEWIPKASPLVEEKSRKSETSQNFDCLYSAESEDEALWRLLTVFSTVEVFETEGEAKQAHAGLVDYEGVQGRDPAEIKGGAMVDAAVSSSVRNEEDSETQWRWIALTGDATVSVHVFLSGMEPEEKSGADLAAEVGERIIAGLPREGGN
ncbi:hypothetical protein [Salininema proteolyticum]|uniref:Uncharacterized protein n=1 Tax=Salininema proteolyticum TaxID=1607685 RepID=A0ABV8TW24_9ACTN